MWVSLKTEKRRSRCPVFSFRQRLRRAKRLPGMTTEDLHGNQRRSAPPALLPLICMVIPDHSSFSVLRETSHGPSSVSITPSAQQPHRSGTPPQVGGALAYSSLTRSQPEMELNPYDSGNSPLRACPIFVVGL